MFALYRRYDRQHVIENVSFAVAMVCPSSPLSSTYSAPDNVSSTQVGIVLVVLDNEYVDSRTGKLVLRSTNAALTAALLALLVWRFTVVREILIQRNVVPPHVALRRMPVGQLVKLALELAVCAVCVPPGLGNATFTVWEWKTYADAQARPLEAPCDPPYAPDAGGCYLVYSYPCVATRNLIRRSFTLLSSSC